jgi:hypothetical protein
MVGKDAIPWHHAKCFCMHYKRCMFSWCAWANSHSFATYPLILMSIINIVLSINDICTLANVISINPTWMNFISCVKLFHEVAMIVAIPKKEGLYWDQYLVDLFLPLAVEIFGCLHQQLDNFFHCCANMAWPTKVFKGLLLLILCAFYK